MMTSVSVRNEETQTTRSRVNTATPMLCSSNLGETAQSKCFDDVRLYRCGLLVHDIGAECRTDHGARGATALGLSDELCNGLGDVVRVRGVGRLESCHEMLEHRARNLADRSVSCCPVAVGRLLNGRIHGRRKGARLDQDDVDAELRDLVP